MIPLIDDIYEATKLAGIDARNYYLRVRTRSAIELTLKHQKSF